MAGIRCRSALLQRMGGEVVVYGDDLAFIFLDNSKWDERFDQQKRSYDDRHTKNSATGKNGAAGKASRREADQLPAVAQGMAALAPRLPVDQEGLRACTAAVSPRFFIDREWRPAGLTAETNGELQDGRRVCTAAVSPRFFIDQEWRPAGLTAETAGELQDGRRAYTAAVSPRFVVDPEWRPAGLTAETDGELQDGCRACTAAVAPRFVVDREWRPAGLTAETDGELHEGRRACTASVAPRFVIDREWRSAGLTAETDGELQEGPRACTSAVARRSSLVEQDLVVTPIAVGMCGMRQPDALASRRHGASGEEDGSRSSRRRRERSADIVLAYARHGGVGERMRVLFSRGVWYACESTLDWIYELVGHPRDQRPTPSHWSWLSIMGSALVQQNGTCALSACTMCVEAQHRLAFERLHGAGSFTFKAKNPSELKLKCLKRSVWTPDHGAETLEVLRVIINSRGVPTTKVPNDVFLPVVAYKKFNTSAKRKLNPFFFASLMHNLGPMVGTLLVDQHYFRDDVYRGRREKEAEGHAVVCFAYCFTGKGLLIQIMDNHQESGPLRWIMYSAFYGFYLPVVEPISPSLLVRKKRWRRHQPDCLQTLVKKILFFL